MKNNGPQEKHVGFNERELKNILKSLMRSKMGLFIYVWALVGVQRMQGRRLEATWACARTPPPPPSRLGWAWIGSWWRTMGPIKFFWAMFRLTIFGPNQDLTLRFLCFVFSFRIQKRNMLKILSPKISPSSHVKQRSWVSRHVHTSLLLRS